MRISAVLVGLALVVVSPGYAAVNNPPYWIQESPQNSPSGRDGYAMAYDAAHGQVVLFGGQGASNNLLSDTWIWDGTNWTQKSPVTSPSARQLHAMAYDAAHGQVVLFGGLNPLNFLSDTWVWDGTNWTQKSPATSPPGRLGHGMAYDAAHGQMVLFGGESNGSLVSDTWVWDGTNWTQKSPATSPSARQGLMMAYDAAHGQVVLFGGLDNSFDFLSDTWVWDGTNWTRKSPATSPPGRQYAAMAYDVAHGQAVLLGGADNFTFSSPFSDTWAWDGTNWTQEMPQSSPPARDKQSMAYDAAHGQVVLFGGNGNLGLLSDTWVWSHGIFASAGNPQSTPAGSAFSFPLEVTIVDNTGAYVNGAQVTFTGPPSMVSFSLHDRHDGPRWSRQDHGHGYCQHRQLPGHGVSLRRRLHGVHTIEREPGQCDGRMPGHYSAG